ncbi:hypothetical protein O181_014704 [Austropuccinia psidii MF-1]|uniref:Uncharacterized protein n=1 Tax=Austropuccinia psidii MF-1 TaxID=1389203 RepID=A0A9Q3BYM0_9BASI|nr:hypothetical protein [Austropuccinia psidii MF-1]
MVAAIQPGAKLGPIGHVISFMANWPPWVFYGSYAITHSKGHSWPQSSFMASLANFHLTNPQAFIFDFGPGGSFCLLGVSRPPSHPPWFWATPFHWRGFGLNGLFGPFRPPTAPTSPPSSQGQVGTKTHLDPPEPKLATISFGPKIGQRPSGHQFGDKSCRTHFLAMDHHGPISQPWPLATTRGPQISSVSLPLNLWGILSIPSYHPYSRLQAWCIYGIIYHYAPFLLSNAMVTFSGPISTFLYQGLKIQCQFQRRIIQLIGLTSYGGNQKTLQGSQPPVSAGVGLVHYSGLFKGKFSRGITSMQSVVKASSISILLGQLNSSIQASFNQPVWPWPNWAISYSTV